VSAFFPLDEELQLLPGKYTPQIQEAMTRLGSKIPYEQAVEEVWLNQHTRVEEYTLRETTNRHGQIAEAIVKAEADKLATQAPTAKAVPKQVLVSSDGANIRLTNGEWREVKTVVVGEFDSRWNEKEAATEVQTQNISYFSRSYQIREFEQYALPELYRRGVFNAGQVVTVNDGSEWIQSFADYHIPEATRILDFRHALDHLLDAGQAVLGEGTEACRQWFSTMAHQLKHKPPQRTIADLCFLESQANSDEQVAAIDKERRYLQKREKLIDYPHFQNKGYPIGSGSVESSHKVVVHSRMKQAGMRWADHNIDPMLALRNLVCNGRWSSGWKQIVAFHWEERRREWREHARRQRPSTPPIPLTFAAVKVASTAKKENDESSAAPSKQPNPYRPANNHPWRRNIWPTKEAWRWN
jgi:hypothetical protein